jgi:hypothetical protein
MLYHGCARGRALYLASLTRRMSDISDDRRQLTEAVSQVLESQGVLCSLRAQLRQCVFESVDEIGVRKGQASMIRDRGNPLRDKLLQTGVTTLSRWYPYTCDDVLTQNLTEVSIAADDGVLALSLAADLLRQGGLMYTAKVFEAEAGLPLASIVDREALFNQLGLDQTGDTSTPVLACLLAGRQQHSVDRWSYAPDRTADTKPFLAAVKTTEAGGGSNSPSGQPGTAIPAFSGAGEIEAPTASDSDLSSLSSPAAVTTSATGEHANAGRMSGKGLASSMDAVNDVGTTTDAAKPLTEPRSSGMASGRVSQERSQSSASSIDGDLPLPDDEIDNDDNSHGRHSGHNDAPLDPNDGT